MATLAIGTQVELVFQTQFVTFTPEQFSKALKDKNYMEAQGQISDPNNPNVRPFSFQTFSKADTTVFLAPGVPPTPIVFRVINTLNLEAKYKEVKEMLVALNIYNEIVSDASFTCTTRVLAKTRPQDRLTAIVNKSFVARMKKNFDAKINVFSIRLATSFPVGRDGGYQIIIEPLMTNPEKEYFVNISYRTHNMVDFDKFISQFGNDLIQRIIEETD